MGLALYYHGTQNNQGEGEEGREGKEGKKIFTNYLVGLLAALFVAVIGNLQVISNLRTLNT